MEQDTGNILLIIGIALLIAGVLFKAGIKFGSLPGDIKIEKENFTFYFPLSSSILISLVLTMLFILFRHLSK
ncbi:MAG: DUF2905 domain-containing protein [Nanobdellota archaeon]